MTWRCIHTQTHICKFIEVLFLIVRNLKNYVLHLMNRQMIQYSSAIRIDAVRAGTCSVCFLAATGWAAVFPGWWTMNTNKSFLLYIVLLRHFVSKESLLVPRKQGHCHGFLNTWFRSNLWNWFVGEIWKILEGMDRESLELCKQYLRNEYSSSSEAQNTGGNTEGETVLSPVLEAYLREPLLMAVRWGSVKARVPATFRCKKGVFLRNHCQTSLSWCSFEIHRFTHSGQQTNRKCHPKKVYPQEVGSCFQM